jgi:hypothetical protein
MLACPEFGFCLLRTLDACYAVDKAMCGTSSSAISKIKTLRTMDRFEYLNSDELIEWWEAVFCQLDDEIGRGDSSLLSITLRVDAILEGSERLGDEAEFLDEMKEIYALGEVPLEDHLESVFKSILRRRRLLDTSSEILRKSLEKSKRRDGGGEQDEKTKKFRTNFRGQDIINEGRSSTYPKS